MAQTLDGKKIAIGDPSPDQYDGLILPGGTVNADRLRADDDVVRFVQTYVRSGKPVGVICHGPWILVEADLVRDRMLTSYPGLRTDIRNAGGNCAKIVEEFAEGKHEVAAAGATA